MAAAKRRAAPDHAVKCCSTVCRGGPLGRGELRRGSTGVGVTVNLSVGPPNPRLVDEVESSRAEWVARRQLTLEITETAAMADLAPALRTMRELRSLGESALHSTTSAPVTRRSRTSASSRSTCSRSPSRSSTASPPSRPTRCSSTRSSGSAARWGWERWRRASKWTANARTLCSRLAATSARLLVLTPAARRIRS